MAIGKNTTANYSDSLSILNLRVESPIDSFNQLLLNWAGLTVPLTIRSSLIIGTNASLVSHYSALTAANAFIDGTALFSNDAREDFGQLRLDSGCILNLTGGNMACSNLVFGTAEFSQTGGRNVVQCLALPRVVGSINIEEERGSYLLRGGILLSGDLSVGEPTTPWQGNGYGTFRQTGGEHTNSAMRISGYYDLSTRYLGQYELENGVLVSATVTNLNGLFDQNGGTNIIHELVLEQAGRFQLDGGELVTFKMSAYGDSYVGGGFYQSGGAHTVRGKLLIKGGAVEPFDNWGSFAYLLGGGALITENIDLQGALRISSGGVLTNKGTLILGGALAVDSGTHHLGKLQCMGGKLIIHRHDNSHAAVLRFSDSHTLFWGTRLNIFNWGSARGDHIYFGTSSHALSQAQLSQIRFIGRDYTTNSAILLETGEIVPAVGPALVYSRFGNELVLSWLGEAYQLVAATNIAGPYMLVPGASSPVTNGMTDPYRFFRLRFTPQ